MKKTIAIARKDGKFDLFESGAGYKVVEELDSYSQATYVVQNYHAPYRSYWSSPQRYVDGLSHSYTFYQPGFHNRIYYQFYAAYLATYYVSVKLVRARIIGKVWSDQNNVDYASDLKLVSAANIVNHTDLEI